MRKALIQTSAYWEMRHVSPEDDAQDLRVEMYHNGLPGGVRDSSTGIAQITGNTAVRAWNHCISRGHTAGILRDPEKDSDLYAVWQQVRQDGQFALETVAMIHRWSSEGKPGGNNPPNGESVMRPMALDYSEREIYEVLRRYQGRGDDPDLSLAVARRMALFYIFERYNTIARNA